MLIEVGKRCEPENIYNDIAQWTASLKILMPQIREYYTNKKMKFAH